MTQQEQQQFTESLEGALSWIAHIHERLKANDITTGPRQALEARLKETEEIHQSEHEGRVKVDMALVAAESLLQGEDEELRNQTHAKLKELKNLWEETCTYIIHCHSRIEWVWLHWSEYLKAYEEFELWLSRQQRGLAVGLELQLGVKEKLWQVDQHRVVLSDIQGQAALLERLLDEAATLHNRTMDPSVDQSAQETLQEAYNDVRDRAEERLSLLHSMAEEHQAYCGCVQRFQCWLLAKTKELSDLMDREETAEGKLQALQVFDDSVAAEEKTLQHIEGCAEAVRANTSPLGAEQVVEEAEELRLGWFRLRQGLCEAEDGLRSNLHSHTQYVGRCQRLGEDIARLRGLLLGLEQELEPGGDHQGTEQSEEHMVGQWRKYTGVRKTLVGEESLVELLKAQLKDLFRFSEDSRHLSDDVLAVVKEHQSVKCRAARLCSESECGLRSRLQDPVLLYSQWSHRVSHLLEASAELTDFSNVTMLLQSIEHLLEESVVLQERVGGLQGEGELLDCVFGAERADGLQEQLSAAARNRQLLHTQLLQRKSQLQGLISRTKGFDDAYQSIRSKMAALRGRLLAADTLQPDILAKKSKSDQLMVIQKELEECSAHLTALETVVSSSQSNRTQFEKLQSDWRYLHHQLRMKVSESEEDITDHESFHNSLLNMEKWLMIMKQKLESFHSTAGEWSVEGRMQEAQRALGEFPEKELELQQMSAQGQGVLERTSEEGQVHILRDMARLREAWLALYNMSLNLHRLLNSSTESDSQGAGGWSPHSTAPPTELRVGAEGGQARGGGSSSRHTAHQQQHDGMERSGTGRGGGSLEGEERIGGPGGMVLTQGEGPLSPTRTGTGNRHSFRADEVDSPGWSTRADQQVSPGGGSSITAVDRGTGFSSGGGLSWVDGGLEAGGGLSPGRGASINSASQTSTAATKHTTGSSSEYSSRRLEFEAWLSQQSELLSGILTTKAATLSTGEVQSRQDTLKGLRGAVGWGQEQFNMLLQESEGAEAEQAYLEELRYRWMLHKSKLKDVGELRARAKKVKAKPEEPAITAKVQKRPGLCQRVCRLALPLWLLLMALLLLAFLLPLIGENSSCSLSNNFARSFNIMLRYEGPPPT